ncbi:MAG: family 43 glycosylhydrolase, partial [Bacteroidales bacterium]|nr:family 43 glycosylhydrolase [Bacteroidales bacterium]
FDDYKQQTTQAVEGSSLFQLINSDTYILMYDMYMAGKYQFTESTDLKEFTVIDHEISMDFHPRHGSIIPITRKELMRLIAKWGHPEEFPAVPNNPVLEGYFADPEIIYSEKHGKYFLYPTSDGYHGWSGTYFKTFSSEDLVTWEEEAVILDLKKDVEWADRNAWAPCAVEVKKGKKYKYYYYFTAAQKIGVAVADHPAGPFSDSGKPLINFKPEGINRGQEIDPDIFIDPKSKKPYLFWGNGYLAVVELEKNMTEIKPGTEKVLTPSDNTFREGVEVFYRNGLYYFLWSENDTRIKVPGKDEWYIVYHRFNRPNGIKMGSDAGFHREVAIDKMEFNNDGSIKVVEPTI